MPTASLVSLDDIRAARARLEGVARRTPVLPASSETGWRHLLVKCENLQATGAFKLRGAYNLISQIDPAVRARGVVTYSSGITARPSPGLPRGFRSRPSSSCRPRRLP
jgi:threonine dehydratase